MAKTKRFVIPKDHAIAVGVTSILRTELYTYTHINIYVHYMLHARVHNQ